MDYFRIAHNYFLENKVLCYADSQDIQDAPTDFQWIISAFCLAGRAGRNLRPGLDISQSGTAMDAGLISNVYILVYAFDFFFYYH